MDKKSVSAKAVLEDIRAELSDAEMMAKYDLSEEQLEKLFKKMIAAGQVTKGDLNYRMQEGRSVIEMPQGPVDGVLKEIDTAPSQEDLTLKFELFNQPVDRTLADMPPPTNSKKEAHVPRQKVTATDKSYSPNGRFELIEVAPEFPRNLLRFEQYDGAKTLAAAIFALALYWFVSGFFGEPSKWYQIWRPITDSLGFAARLTTLLITYLILWVTFDKRNVEGYALSLLAAVFGIMYIVSPSDFIPDVPFVGMLDDAAIGGGAIWLGVKNYMKAKFENQNAERIKDCLVRGEVERALELFAEDKGFVLRQNRNDS